jgi:hypothetical protein
MQSPCARVLRRTYSAGLCKTNGLHAVETRRRAQFGLTSEWGIGDKHGQDDQREQPSAASNLPEIRNCESTEQLQAIASSEARFEWPQEGGGGGAEMVDTGRSRNMAVAEQF